MKNFVTAFLALAMTISGFGSPVLAHDKCVKKEGCKHKKECTKPKCNKGAADDCCKDKHDDTNSKVEDDAAGSTKDKN